MLMKRSGVAPTVSADAWVASSAVVAGNVTIGADCVIDNGALQVSSGPQIRIAAGVTVMPGAVIRSTGDADRPAFQVEIGMDCLIGPQASLAGCQLGEAVDVATQGMIFSGRPDP
jgi:carbonic anhydrase/acetyltransferase-like protein (isoleucine patch superfamily)